MTSSRTPLIVAGAAALTLGVLAAVFLREKPKAPDVVERGPTAQRTLEAAARLIPAPPPPPEMRGGEEFLEDRWGHMGDVGLTMPMTDTNGEKYFVEPKVFQAWTRNGRNYAVAISQMFMMDETQRWKGKTNPEYFLTLENWKPNEVTQRILENYKPITDPEKLPEGMPGYVRTVFK